MSRKTLEKTPEKGTWNVEFNVRLERNNIMKGDVNEMTGYMDQVEAFTVLQRPTDHQRTRLLKLKGWMAWLFEGLHA